MRRNQLRVTYSRRVPRCVFNAASLHRFEETMESFDSVQTQSTPYTYIAAVQAFLCCFHFSACVASYPVVALLDAGLMKRFSSCCTDAARRVPALCMLSGIRS